MASLVSRHPKTVMLTAVATCLICLPLLLPLLLISSPFLFFTSLFSVCFMALFRSLLRVIHFSFPWQSRIIGNSKGGLKLPKCRGDEGWGSLGDVQLRAGGRLMQSRVHEYLEDQLKNLNVEVFEGSEIGEDPLPCSFSFGPLESMDDSLLS